MLLYEWKLNGFTKYQTVTLVQQMTLTVTAFKLNNTRAEEPTIAHLLVKGFNGSLKAWWDNYLTSREKEEIFVAVKIEEVNGQPTQVS